ncbi:MAG: hypothetical protein HKN25_15580, partial [Pyrinomonadaceae bacterium]|nr:hypothetical protein [Pyrinomonadaceae bacterium]
SNLRSAKIKSGRAFVDQAGEKIKLEAVVDIKLTPKSNRAGGISQPIDVKALKATAYFSDREIRKIDLNGNVDVYQKPTSKDPNWIRTKAGRAIAVLDQELKKLELYENVYIETVRDGSKPTKIRAGTAFYGKASDTFDLEENVEITTVEDSKPTRIKASRAVYEQTNGKISLYGNAEVFQGEDLVKGELLDAVLFPNKRIKFAKANGNAFLRQKNSDRVTEIKSGALNATFNADQDLQDANAIGESSVTIVPSESDEYEKLTMVALKSIRLDFRKDGTLRDLKTDGRTTISLNAPSNIADAANKKLTADSIDTVLRSNGKDLASAKAVGNAVLVVEPLIASTKNYKTVVNSPSFTCDFYSGNNAKSCSAKGKSKVVRTPTGGGRAKQTLTANNLDAYFDKRSQDVDRFETTGNAKYSEGDRNGIADKITYSGKEQFVRFRGSQPTVWDSRARAKANEIDWDVGEDRSSLRGKVSTTYYSQNQTGGATPFTRTSSPVFVTADTGSFDHKEETALYTGNARAWQDNNYIRAERLLLQQKEGQLFAEGKVQSKLYDANRTVRGRKSKIPVFASSRKMLFQQKKNLLRYESDVDIRQGTDRIEGGIANVFLDGDNNLKRTVIEKDVVITQPNRRASGSYAEYDAVSENVILRGNPARVRDEENGSSEAREVTVDLKTNRVVGKGKTTKNSTGRIRSVYKVKKGTIN